MIYVLYDKPQALEDMSFLTSAIETEYEEIYPACRCTSIKQMLSVCSETVKRTKEADTIICWYDFMGVLCWWLSKLMNRKVKIVAINILLKDKRTIKNRMAKFLYRKAVNSPAFRATVTAKEYGEYVNGILGTKREFTLVHDVYHKNYALDEFVETKENTVFCGGRNGRDWKTLFDLSKKMPDVTFLCVMSSALKERLSETLGDNVYVITDVSENAFTKLLCESQLIAMPLDTEAPAGLTVFFQAAANNKMVITTDTVTTREYFANGRGVLCEKDIEEWAHQIRYYLSHTDAANACAANFKSFLETECSEKRYAETLWRIIAE